MRAPEVGVVVIPPERRDLVLDAVALDGDRPEGVLVDRPGEEGLDLFRPGVGREVPVMRRSAEQDITERTADDPGRSPVSFEDPEDRLDRRRDPAREREVDLVRDQLRPRKR